MKKLSSFLAVALLTVACVLVGFHGCRTSRPVVPLTSTQPVDRANWMHDRLDTLGNRSLGQLVLPASHDSAMYLTGFPQSLARTQNLSLYGQLTAGVRWFDLRPRFRDGELTTCHGPVTGPKLTDVLGDVRRFMAEGHRELVLLKFSHYEGFSAPVYSAFVKQVRETLGRWLFISRHKGKRLADLPLADFIQNAGTVLILCDGHYPLDVPTPGIWVYRDWDSADPQLGDLCVFDQYSNTMSLDTLKADQLKKFSAFTGTCRHRPDVPCDLFLLSWTLTPPTDVPAFAAEPNRQLAAQLQRITIPNSSGRIINLLYADCVDASLTDIAIRQNR